MVLYNAIMTLKNFVFYAYDCFDSIKFELPYAPFGAISLMEILVGFLVFSMIINLFLKVARS